MVSSLETRIWQKRIYARFMVTKSAWEKSKQAFSMNQEKNLFFASRNSCFIVKWVNFQKLLDFI